MIDTREKLDRLLPRVRATRWIALDTEADSLHAYPEKLCLLQLTTESGDVLVDPLAGFSINLLLEALTGHELILHGADYDLRLLRKHHQFVPTAVFDTMLAARLLGQRQFGLGHLVQSHLSVRLDKAPQKANWAMRPLTERMKQYALNDTRHLKPLADRLREELEGKQRLAWHQDWCAQLVAECAEPPNSNSDQPWRIKGSAVLSRRALGILRELWQWREAEAVAANRPPYFVLAHEKMLRISIAAAGHHPVEKLLPAGLSRRRKEGAGEAIHRGLKLALDHLPEAFKHNHRRPSESERRRFADLEKRRDKRARQLDIDATLIASKGDLSRLAHDWDTHSARLMDWQRELLQH